MVSGLKEHTRKHTGDRPFKCWECDKQFAKSCNRLAHFRSTHGKKTLGALGGEMEGGEGRNGGGDGIWCDMYRLFMPLSDLLIIWFSRLA